MTDEYLYKIYNKKTGQYYDPKNTGYGRNYASYKNAAIARTFNRLPVEDHDIHQFKMERIFGGCDV